MGFNKQTAIENKTMFEAAQIEIERLGYDPDKDGSVSPQVFAILSPQFPDIPASRLKHQISRVIMKKRGQSWRQNRGAPVGNTNATRKDSQPRVGLSVRVEQLTEAWLQAQAGIAHDGNIGRWLDSLAKQS